MTVRAAALRQKQQEAIESTFYYVLHTHTGPPSETHPMISYNQSGLSLTISWGEPFTHPGFNITEYSLQIVNRSSNAAMTRTVPVGLDRVYVDTVDAPPSQCNELDYIVTAFNSIGNSTASVSGGFPISKCYFSFYRVIQEYVYFMYNYESLCRLC